MFELSPIAPIEYELILLELKLSCIIQCQIFNVLRLN